MKRCVYYMLLAVMAIAATSCEHKELCYVHPHYTRIKVVYDWSDAPEASPAGMCAYFYSLDRKGVYHRFDFPGAKEGYIELPEGRYVLQTYNNDTEAVVFASVHDFDNHTAFTRSGDILEPMFGNGVISSVRGPDDERVVITPDEFYGCTATDIVIADHKVSYTFTRGDGSRGDVEIMEVENGDQVITLYPHDYLCHYSYEVRNVTQAKHVSRVSAAISGMSGQMNLSTEGLHTEPLTLPLSAEANASTQKITGEFLTFGHHEEVIDPHRMSFYVEMDDGARYSFKSGSKLDVTEQVHSASNRRRVHLIIDGLDLPEPIENGSGFRPEIDDWGVVREDINM